MDAVLYAMLKNKITETTYDDTEIRQELLKVAENATDMNSSIAQNTNNIEKKLDKNQGASNSGKITGINESGDIVPMFPQGVTYNEDTQCLEYGADEKLNLNAGIQLDDTLSKVGYAADAASVGELKSDLGNLVESAYKAMNIEIDEYVNGSYSNDGVLVDNIENRVRTKSFILLRKGQTIFVENIPSNQKVTVSRFDVKTGQCVFEGWEQGYPFTADKDYNIIVMWKKTDDTNILPSDIISKTFIKSVIEKDIETLQLKVDNLNDLEYELEHINRYVKGSFAQDGVYDNIPNRLRTDVLTVRKGDVINIKNGQFYHAVGIWKGNELTAGNNIRNDSEWVISDETLYIEYDGVVVITFKNPNDIDIIISDFDGSISIVRYHKLIDSVYHAKKSRITPQLIGHGRYGEAHANSISHFKWLVKNRKIKFIECDIVDSADGVSVCTHLEDPNNYIVYDYYNNRTNIDIPSMTWSQISEYKWTSAEDLEYPSEPIVRVETVLRICQRNNLALWIDVQQSSKESIIKILDFAKKLGIEKNVFFEQYIMTVEECRNIDGFNATVLNVLTKSDVLNATKYLTGKNDVIVCVLPYSEENPYEMTDYIHSFGMYAAMSGGTEDMNVFENALLFGYDFMLTNTLSNDDYF